MSPEKATSSSAALRDQIAKAKAAKKTPAIRKGLQSSTQNDDSAFDPFADPFNTKPRGSSGLLRKRIEAARGDGRLNIAGMGLTSIPDEVLTMYDQREDSSLNWSQMTDLALFVAADNDLDMISDDIFPDVTTEVAMDNEIKGLQFRGIEMLDLHGNNLQAVPTGLRWLERLTTLNLVSSVIFNLESAITYNQRLITSWATPSLTPLASSSHYESSDWATTTCPATFLNQ